MDTMVKDGGFVPGAGGLPKVVEGLSELLNCVRLSLSVRQGRFAYDRDMGSSLYLLDRQEEHAADRALAMANEALLWLPGVSLYTSPAITLRRMPISDTSSGLLPLSSIYLALMRSKISL